MTDELLGITSALQQDLDDLSQRSAANTMVTNAAKTKCLVVTRKRLTNKIVASSLNLHLGNSNIELFYNLRIHFTYIFTLIMVLLGLKATSLSVELLLCVTLLK